MQQRLPVESGSSVIVVNRRGRKGKLVGGLAERIIAEVAAQV